MDRKAESSLVEYWLEQSREGGCKNDLINFRLGSVQKSRCIYNHT